MPDAFETALDFVHTSLREMHSRGIHLRAPAEVLDLLIEASAMPGIDGGEIIVETEEKEHTETLTITSVSRVEALVEPRVVPPAQIEPVPVAVPRVLEDGRSKGGTIGGASRASAGVHALSRIWCVRVLRLFLESGTRMPS